MKNLACGLETSAVLGPAMQNRHRADFATSVNFTSTVLRTVNTWFERSESRRQLRRLNDQLLADIGLSRQQALDEANKSFWQE